MGFGTSSRRYRQLRTSRQMFINLRKPNSLAARAKCWLWLFVALSFGSRVAEANTEHYRHVVFDNSLTSDAYFYSAGTANGPSFLEQTNSRLPVDTKTFL